MHFWHQLEVLGLDHLKKLISLSLKSLVCYYWKRKVNHQVFQVSAAPPGTGQPASLADALASALNKRKDKVAGSDDDDDDDDW